MSIVEAVLHRHKLRQERHDPAHRNNRTRRSLAAKHAAPARAWMASGGLGCYKHATPTELLCPGLIPPETARNEVPSVGGCPWQARKNRLASAVGKQDDSGVNQATAANGNQGASVAPALLAGPGAKAEAVSQLMKLRTPLWFGPTRDGIKLVEESVSK
jgi:hypothetical protein